MTWSICLKIKQNPHKINDKIMASEVRLVGDNVEMGVYPIAKAMSIANELELDFVVGHNFLRF